MGKAVGADVAELRSVAARLTATAGQLDAIAAELSAQLGRVPWVGPDAASFRSRWAQQCRGDVAGAVVAIREAGKILGRNADEQEQASSALGPGLASAAVGGSRAAESFLNLARSSKDAHAVAKAWKDLSESERAALIRDHPELIGGLNGIPGADRSAANKSRIADLRKDLESQPDNAVRKAKLASLKAIEEVLRQHPDAQLLTLDLSQERAMAAISLGDVDRAKNVSVFTPGFGSTVDGSMQNYVGQMEMLRNRCDQMTGRPGETAMVTWIGYQAPQKTMDSLLDPSSSVLSPSAAVTGGRSLAGFLSGLDASRQGDVHLTAIGHSYGSTTTAAAMLELGKQGNNPVDSAAFFGSPGLLTRDAANFGLDNNGQAYVLEANKDLIADTDWFGRDAQKVTGVRNLSTEGSTGHSEYLANESKSQHNLAAVVTGRQDQLVSADGGTRDAGDRWVPAAQVAAGRLVGASIAAPAGPLIAPTAGALFAGGLIIKQLAQ